MLLLLLLTTLLVLCLPLLPALDEWWRPTDVVPLHIDGDDAIDPPYLARRFAQHLQLAIEGGETQLGESKIVRITSPGERWPMDERETRYAASRRLWRVDGSAELPAGITFLAEVAVEHDVVTAPRGVYRALLAGGRMKLAPRTRVLRWAHGDEIQIDRACRLPGRVVQNAASTLARVCVLVCFMRRRSGLRTMPNPQWRPPLRRCWHR